ncbi:hypothetical protein PFDG_03773 [Plasmodium falciparum Dd2]|uniref:GTP-binding protein n=1 Tax=Plasmodium falciparum (isolate Dd2) TaxID=57267 RepID=A0A0L7M7L1_PLAF4|nr:hypothetical protein PFDG_03773 [Plasmodium falciparum Dd2]
MLITKNIPFQIIITKIDKLKGNELHNLMIKILSVIDNYKKKVKVYNDNKHKNKNYNNVNYEICDFNINEYIHNVSSLKYFGIQELRANISLIALDNMSSKNKKQK